jgi:outer membrane protein assembly factor BamB
MLYRTTALAGSPLLGSFLVSASVSSAADWPRFRGPNGAGIAEDKNIPVQWNEKEGMLWKVPLPGLGNSSPIIWGKQLFVQSSSEDGKERYLLCLDVGDGKILWKRMVPGSTAHTHRKNTLASSTPAADGERVYALFWDGSEIVLHAFDFAGNPVWNYPLGKFTSQHGVGSSPVVYNGKVFLNNDQDGSSDLIALDARTGKLTWKSPRPAFRTCYSSPFLLEQREKGEKPQLIVASTAGITSYDPETGAEVWKYVWTFSGKMALRTVGSPVHANGIIFATSGDGSGARHMIAVKVGEKGDVSRTNLLWENEKIYPYVPTMLTLGDHLYYVNDFGIAGCCVAATGETVWNQRLGGNVSASPVLIDGKIYTVTEEGDVHVFLAATELKVLAKNSLGEPVSASPAVANNRLFIRGRNHLFCIGKPAAE